MKRKIFTLLVAMCSIVAINAQIRYVAEGASGDGTSWDNASGDIQEMINELYRLGGGEVWVAAGNYTPTHKIAELYYHNVDDQYYPTADKDKTFLLKRNVKLYGGFLQGAANLEDRDWKANETILNGDNGEYKVCHIVTAYGEIGSACLDGFTIKEGYAKSFDNFNNLMIDGYAILRDRGGAIHIVGASPRLNNLHIEDNFGGLGGGLYTTGEITDLLITNSTFERNSSANGGGLYLRSGNQNVTLINVNIYNNTCTTSGSGLEMVNSGVLNIYGGKIAYNQKNGICQHSGTVNIIDADIFENKVAGIYQRGGEMTIKDSKIYNNEGTEAGGIYSVYANTILSLESVLITGNYSTSKGGGLYKNGGELNMKDCVISHNETTGSGGGLAIMNGITGLNISNCEFSDNTAASSGGGLYLSSTNAYKTDWHDVTIKNNTSGNTGGGMYVGGSVVEYVFMNTKVIGNTSTTSGGGIYLHNSTTSLFANLLVAGNEGSVGGGIQLAATTTTSTLINASIINNTATTSNRGGGINTSGIAHLKNSIVFGNSSINIYPAITDKTTDYPQGTFNNSLIEGISETNLDKISDSQNNINGAEITCDELFIDASNGNYTLLSGAANLAIDAGEEAFIADLNQSYDLAGNDRINNTIDLGAYEYSGVLFKDATYPYEPGVIHSLVLEGVADPTGATYTYTGGPTSDAPGVYTINVTGGGINETATLVVTSDDLVEFSDNNLLQNEIYDGSPKPLTIASVTEGTIEISYNPAVPYAAGIYEVIVSAVKDGYVLGSKTALISIQKAELNIDPTTIVFADQTFIENGSIHSLKIEDEDLLGLDVIYYNNDQINAGNYKVIAELFHKTDKENYYPIELIATMTINEYVAPEPVLYSISYDAGEWGIIKVTYNGFEISSGSYVDAGTSVAISATSTMAGMVLESLTVNGAPVDNNSTIIINSDTEILAVFELEGSDPNPDPVDNVTIGGTHLWTADGYLYILTSQPANVYVLSMTGRIVANQKVSAGETSISLGKGIYIVKVDNKVTKIIVR